MALTEVNAHKTASAREPNFGYELRDSKAEELVEGVIFLEFKIFLGFMIGLNICKRFTASSLIY